MSRLLGRLLVKDNGVLVCGQGTKIIISAFFKENLLCIKD